MAEFLTNLSFILPKMFLFLSISLFGFLLGKILKSLKAIYDDSSLKQVKKIPIIAIFLLFSPTFFTTLLYNQNCSEIEIFIEKYQISSLREGYMRLQYIYSYDNERAEQAKAAGTLFTMPPYSFSKFQDKNFKGVCMDFTSAFICLSKYFHRDVWIAYKQGLLSKELGHIFAFTRVGDEFHAYDQKFDYIFEKIDDLKDLGYFIFKL